MESFGEDRKFLLVTISTLGCGKTTVGNALNTLYGSRMGHIQNDEIPASKTKKKRFVETTKKLLVQHSIVMMDRNNAEKRERAQVFKDIDSPQNVAFVALNFLPRGPNHDSKTQTRKLVHSRDNHMTIRDMPESKINMIMADFEKRFQPLDATSEPDSKFHAIINLVPGQSLQNIKTVLSALDNLGVPSQFNEEEIVEAYTTALKYEPKLFGTTDSKAEPKDRA